MNKNQFVKFSLTLVCSAVLAACSSGGGSGDNSAAKQQAAQQAAAQQAAAAKAAAEKAAAEAAAKAAEKAAAEAAAKAAEKAAAEAAAEAAAKAAEKAKQDALKANEEVGHKFVKKNASNTSVGTGVIKNNDQSTSITSMKIELEPSLDTIVVGIPVDKNTGNADLTKPQGYLEDYDFRGNTDNTQGTHTLSHIYVDEGTKAGQERGVVTNTKTNTMGLKEGTAFVYEKGRKNYTNYGGNDVLETDFVTNPVYLKRLGSESITAKTNDKVQSLDNSVTEVYGHRTFVKGNSQTDKFSKEENLNDLANAPFLRLKGTDKAKDSYVDGTLERVQYGRVTSSLNEKGTELYRDGKELGTYGTKVVSYGEYNKAGTENHYFYRGVDATKYDEALTSKLAGVYATGAEKTPAGSLQYQGHAVTYGLDHTFNSRAGIPNAIGGTQALVSGTHVAANIDLASKAVTGNLYDVWQYGDANKTSLTTNEIASFQGTLENNGSISGTSTRTADKDAGTFNANLFGTQAEELGGALKSNTQEKQWGAVFGAQVQNTPYVPSVKRPEADAWGESSDQADSNSPIK